MATATIKKKVVESVEGVTLELSVREAEFLRFVFDNIAGAAFWCEAPGASFDSGPGATIIKALREGGVQHPSDIKESAPGLFDFKVGR